MMPATSTEPARAALSSGAASEVLLALGLKPVVRELHDVGRVDEATARWQSMGYQTVVGEPVREDVDTAAMVVDIEQLHTTRHLADHPLIERLVAVGGRPARHVLLEPTSRVHRWLANKLHAERTPHQGPLPSGERVQERCAVYVSKESELAERARSLDRMAESTREQDSARELGELLGYPTCCVDAFCELPRRWPNRFPIAASAARSEVFEPRLNNIALHQFAWIAWFPCRYDCDASLAIANAAAEALAQTQPEQVAAADRALARPRLYIDDGHQADLLEATGQATHIRFERLAPLAQSGSLTDPFWEVVAEANTLRINDGHVHLQRDGHTLRWNVSPLLLPFGMS